MLIQNAVGSSSQCSNAHGEMRMSPARGPLQNARIATRVRSRFRPISNLIASSKHAVGNKPGTGVGESTRRFTPVDGESCFFSTSDRYSHEREHPPSRARSVNSEYSTECV